MRKITSGDIARLAGVSRTTVSYVLNGRDSMRIAPETRDRILAVARDAGYQPNRLATALSSGRIHTVGLVTSTDGLSHTRITYWQNLFLELSLVASQSKMQAMMFLEPLVMAQDRQKGLCPTDLLDGRVEGVITFGHSAHKEWMHALIETGLPCVEIGSSNGRASVHGDNRGGIRQAADHLLALGHRRIAYWSPPLISEASEQRAASFRECMEAAGISEADSPVVYSVDSKDLDGLVRGKNRPTALMTFCDAMAVDALFQFRSLGLTVPDDISVTGYDNDLQAVTAYPRLTSVASPIREIAHAAMAMLMKQIDGDTESSAKVIVPTKLVVRDSTAGPPTDSNYK